MRSETHLFADGGATEPGLGAPQLLPSTAGRTFLSEQVRVGRYELMYRLGSGGMATVFVGRLSGPAGFERTVAVKVIHQHLADSKKFIDMFLDEARMAALIHHPNVVEIYEVGRDQGLFFMVGEFVHGPDLGKLLRRVEDRGTPLASEFSAYFAAQVCLGLHAAHETCDKDGNFLNLIHRDVSPNNVLISYDGYVKLIDFGVAWARNKLAHTESGALKGKIGYISPEQILGHDVDRRSDIFSVGVLLYIMATLTHPFPGKSDAERLNKIISGEATPPSSVRPDVHPGLERIILKAMSPSSKDRYPTALDMAKDLDAFIESLDKTVKADDVSALLVSLFEKEKQAHQSSVSAYRAARGLSTPAQTDRDSDDLYPDDIDGTSRNTPASYSSRRPQRISIVISMISLVAVAVIGVLVFAFWSKSVAQKAESSNSAKVPINEAAMPGVGTVPPGHEKTVNGAGSSNTEQAAPTSQPESSDGSFDKSGDSASDPQTMPLENVGSKRKKTKSKKTGADLLHSPYS